MKTTDEEEANQSPSSRVHRYRGLLAVSVLLVGLGVISSSPVLVIAAVIPLVYPLLGAVSTGDPIGDRVDVHRAVSPEAPLPGQPAEVTLTIENTSDQAIVDLRAVDGIPPDLGIHEGEARGGGALRPGDSLELSYSLVPSRGTYRFREVVLQSHNLLGTVVTTDTRKAAGADMLVCRVTVEEVPLARETSAFTGPLATDKGGSGIEFYATREYRRGDPIKRINWRRFARFGELSTVEFREQRAARVAIVIDSRTPAHVAAAPDLPTGATLSAYGAVLAMEVLYEAGHQLAIGVLGVDDPFRGTAPAWASVTDHRSFRHRAATLCNAAASGPETDVTRRGAVVADGGRTRINSQVRWLLTRFRPGTQVLFCSPLLDGQSASIVQAIQAGGHAVTVLSPEVLPDSVGGRVLALERSDRLDLLRSTGADVIDWHTDEPLPMAVARILGQEGR